ncbi:hypothetical protein MJO28_013586 [Puccinia striiformis f. sp. tritici]|uniref:Uncharacterized protein n=1 Tax=Puccinia striiformis f. sp. tritici TaxID=168172 RepID=A0ACC0DUR7_9BASI|nr:hypothetical protein MJO28_013586 [Puccinia striiformis f. sp. tritici]
MPSILNNDLQQWSFVDKVRLHHHDLWPAATQVDIVGGGIVNFWDTFRWKGGRGLNDDQDIIDIKKVNNAPSYLDEEEDNLSPIPIPNAINHIIPEEANLEEENLNNPLSDNNDLNQPTVIPKDVPTEDHQSQLFLDEPALNDLDRPLDIEQQQPMTIISTSDDYLDSAKIIGDSDLRVIESEPSGSLDPTHPDDYHQLPDSSPSI